MAEIPVERKSNLTWLWVLLALILIALLIWWAVGDDEEPIPVREEIVGVDTPGADPITPPEPVGMEAGITIGDILGNPTEYVGDDNINLTGVRVPEVPTDRGFWIEDQGQRIFAVLIDGPVEVPTDINPGQQIVIREAMARDATFIQNIPGQPLDQDTRNILQKQDVYLVVDESNIEILSGSGLNEEAGADAL